MRVIIATAAIVLAVGACAIKDKQWVKEGAGPNTVRSDIYWCTRFYREKFEEMNTKTLGKRRVEKRVDPECMRKKGYRYE